MKSLIIIVCLFITCSVRAQDYPFIKNFVHGTIILKDATQKEGLVRWFPDPSEKLRFKLNNNDPEEKFQIPDLQGFITDTLHFKMLSNLEIYGEDYPMLSRMSKLKYTFAQIIYTGKINVYYVLYNGYDARQGCFEPYPNLIFEKTTDNKPEYAAFPVYINMREKRYDQAKEKLLPFFNEYPAIQEKLKTFNRQTNMLGVVDYIKQIPATKNE
ncbi:MULTISPECIES: hypothetical protein [Niastella]|uniref:DUF4105 domain-containing protein n=1 Tax=Niastella soli TaxID=2821487 RepID=A0ABS3Z4C5_9BACT|nr:hypothetical protein [Niastella soli]MBO9205008.1 hypothetical protein [Niastella soli]